MLLPEQEKAQKTARLHFTKIQDSPSTQGGTFGKALAHTETRQTGWTHPGGGRVPADGLRGQVTGEEPNLLLRLLRPWPTSTFCGEDSQDRSF